MDKLHKYAKNFINFYFPNLGVRVRQSKENSADYEKRILRLNLRDDEDFGFMRHLRESHCCELSCISSMIWTILHEVGHFVTIDEISDEDYETSLSIKAYLSVVDIENDTTLQDEYFNTPTEWKATEWAIEWVVKNFDDAYHASKELKRLA